MIDGVTKKTRDGLEEGPARWCVLVVDEVPLLLAWAQGWAAPDRLTEPQTPIFAGIPAENRASGDPLQVAQKIISSLTEMSVRSKAKRLSDLSWPLDC